MPAQRSRCALVLLALVAGAACGDHGTSPGDREVASVVVTPELQSVMYLDEVVEFTAAAYDASGGPLSEAAITWSVDDEAVATLEPAMETARLTTVGFGETEVRAIADNGVESTATLRVTGQSSLDFLVGTWNVTGSLRRDDGGTDDVVGVSTVSGYDGGRVLTETLRTDGTGVEAAELSVLHAPVGTGGAWASVRADGFRGSFVVAVGSFADGSGVFTSGNRFGSTVRERMTWSGFRADAFDLLVEETTDGGTTWVTLWDLTYVRNPGATFPSPPPLPSPACAADPHGAFDYWAGAWDVESPRGSPAGSNTVERVASGCAVQENWRGLDGSIGVSLNGFDARRAGWTQVYFDAGGSTLELTGGPVGEVMTLGGTRGNLLDRIRWIPLPDAVRQLWETSPDGGTTWSVFFDGYYLPR